MLDRYHIKAIVITTLAITLAASPALAGGFTSQGQRDWVATAQGLITAPNKGNEAMTMQCVGFMELGGGPEFRREIYQVPKWAAFAHLWTCHAYKIIANSGKNVHGDNDSCQSLKLAIRELDAAKQGENPDDVVAVATQLKNSLVSLHTDLEGARACGRHR